MQLQGRTEKQRVAKPLTTQFVKRQPRLTKPLELKKRPEPKRRRVARRMVSVRAKMQRHHPGAGFELARTLRALARPIGSIRRATEFGSVDVELSRIAEALEGAKEAEQKIDMSLELLDIEALDTGRYHALVIQDPDDKRNLHGFCRLSWLYIPRLHDTTIQHSQPAIASEWANYYIAGPVRHLAEAMNKYTAIKAYVGERVTVDNPEAFRIPWIYHYYSVHAYGLSNAEWEVLGRYLVQGGFIFADAAPSGRQNVAQSHRKNLQAALETQGIRSEFEILLANHPVYHSYFDFAMPPPGVEANNPGMEAPAWLEGLEIGDRLVALLSEKGYYSPWCDWGENAGRIGPRNLDPTRQFQFGVNTIIFALTQEGSLTHRLMDSVRY